MARMFCCIMSFPLPLVSSHSSSLPKWLHIMTESHARPAISFISQNWFLSCRIKTWVDSPTIKFCFYIGVGVTNHSDDRPTQSWIWLNEGTHIVHYLICSMGNRGRPDLSSSLTSSLPLWIVCAIHIRRISSRKRHRTPDSTWARFHWDFFPHFDTKFNVMLSVMHCHTKIT